MTVTYLPEVPITSIVPHPANPRRDLDDIDALADSIRAQGILEPLLLAHLNGTQHRLIAGHRRLAAAKAAGLTTVPARLDEALDTPDKQLAAMLVENTQRSDLSPAEEAAAYAQLVAFPGMTQAKAAKATGRSAKTVRNRLALAKLPEKTLQKVHTGQVTLADAEALIEFVGTPEYDGLARQVGSSNFTWAVQRARENARIRAAREAVEKACAERGWETRDRRDAGDVFLSSWNVASYTPAALDELLAGLDGPYFFVVSHGDTWMLCAPLAAGADEDDDEAPSRYEPDPETKARRAAQQQRAADVETARTVRAAWLTNRMANLLVKDNERAPLLRLLVADAIDIADDDDAIDIADDDDAVAEFLGMPPVPEGARAWDDAVIDARRAWAADLNENQAWKALIALTFDVVRCGSTWDDSHIPSIRVAKALGYEPSDVETALISPTADESTAPA